MGPRAGAPQRPLPPCNKLLPCSLTAVVLMATPCTKSLGGGGGGCKHGGEEGREIPNLLHRRRANAGPIVRMSALNVAREEGSGRKCHKKQKNLYPLFKTIEATMGGRIACNGAPGLSLAPTQVRLGASPVFRSNNSWIGVREHVVANMNLTQKCGLFNAHRRRSELSRCR